MKPLSLFTRPLIIAALLASAGAASAQDMAENQSAAQLGYANAVTNPPSGWSGPVFTLSHDYPASAPATCSTTECPWLGLNVNFDLDLSGPAPTWGGVWDQYIQSVLDYVKNGQDPMLQNEKGWNVAPTGAPAWYHVPWMAYDPTRGREFVHGLTNERTAQLSDFGHQGVQSAHFGRGRLMLANKQLTKDQFETWAFGVYNRWGAAAIGKSIGQNGVPIIGSYGGVPTPAGLPFPEGTVVAKLLFTAATPKDVPYLKDSPNWQADRHIEAEGGFSCQRKVQEVRLIQLDVAVVDSRSPTRWVFGTFAWNGDKPGKTAWDKLEPVGLQWGSDPWTFPAIARSENVPAHESVLNTKIGTPQHFGCNGRLAGPVDNKLSSCLSCHGGAFSPPAGVAATATTTPPIFGFDAQCSNNTLDNTNYFSNTQFPMAYSGGQFPNLLNMDTSLQMQVAYFQYGQYKQYGKPEACQDDIHN